MNIGLFLYQKKPQEMFDNVKREFIQENGVANGYTTKRSDVFVNYQKSVPKKVDLQAHGHWDSMKHNITLHRAVRAANPSWKSGQKFELSILKNVIRESVEATLKKVNGEYGETFARTSVEVSVYLGVNSNKSGGHLLELAFKKHPSLCSVKFRKRIALILY